MIPAPTMCALCRSGAPADRRPAPFVGGDGARPMQRQCPLDMTGATPLSFFTQP
jgi:hypothetical protein